jgi:hypothetical protein
VLNGLICLVFVQLVMLVISGGLYLRQRQHADAQGRDILTWSVKIDAASNKADSAVAHVDKIDTEHYRALKSKYETLALEFDDLKRSFRALEERYERLKLDKAAEAKATSRAAGRPAIAPAPHLGPMPRGPVPDDDPDAALRALVESGEAIPLPRANGAPNPSPVRSTFGQPAH